MLLEHLDEPFGILDFDCFVFSERPIQGLEFAPSEFILGIEGPEWQRRQGPQILPRTYMLYLEPTILRDLMRRHRVSCEAYKKVPRRLSSVLDRAAYRYLDTLQLLMLLGLAEGYKIRCRPMEERDLSHIGRATRATNPVGGLAAGPAHRYLKKTMSEIFRQPRGSA